MAVALHLRTGAGDPALMLATIAAQVQAGDRVTVALLPGAGRIEVPPPARVVHVPGETGWDALLDLVFEADRVVTW